MTLSSKFQLVLPRGARERLKLRPGMKITVVDKGGVYTSFPSARCARIGVSCAA